MASWGLTVQRGPWKETARDRKMPVHGKNTHDPDSPWNMYAPAPIVAPQSSNVVPYTVIQKPPKYLYNSLAPIPGHRLPRPTMASGLPQPDIHLEARNVGEHIAGPGTMNGSASFGTHTTNSIVKPPPSMISESSGHDYYDARGPDDPSFAVAGWLSDLEQTIAASKARLSQVQSDLIAEQVLSPHNSTYDYHLQHQQVESELKAVETLSLRLEKISHNKPEMDMTADQALDLIQTISQKSGKLEQAFDQRTSGLADELEDAESHGYVHKVAVLRQQIEQINTESKRTKLAYVEAQEALQQQLNILRTENIKLKGEQEDLVFKMGEIEGMLRNAKHDTVEKAVEEAAYKSVSEETNINHPSLQNVVVEVKREMSKEIKERDDAIHQLEAQVMGLQLKFLKSVKEEVFNKVIKQAAITLASTHTFNQEARSYAKYVSTSLAEGSTAIQDVDERLTMHIQASRLRHEMTDAVFNNFQQTISTALNEILAQSQAGYTQNELLATRFHLNMLGKAVQALESETLNMTRQFQSIYDHQIQISEQVLANKNALKMARIPEQQQALQHQVVVTSHATPMILDLPKENIVVNSRRGSDTSTSSQDSNGSLYTPGPSDQRRERGVAKKTYRTRNKKK